MERNGKIWYHFNEFNHKRGGTKMSFGAKLVEQRKKHAYSQEQLSDKIGVSRQAISRWEADDTLPDANNP